MKFYTGDIIEIITSKYKSVSDVPAGEIGYYENCGIPIPYIGQRFKVACWNNNIAHRFCNKNNNFDFLFFEENNITLYKRPIKNWIKYFINLFQ